MPVDPAKLAIHFGRSRNVAPPRHLGTRYDVSGTFLTEPGNTVVCHLVQGSETERALADAQARYRVMPGAGKLAFTPTKSYHMTLFQGVIEGEGRRSYPYWPADVASDLPMPEMTRLMEARLDRLPSLSSFKVEVTAAVPTGLLVNGVTAADRHTMAAWRNAFAEILGYRHADHDSYQFHITMAYVIDWIDDAALPGWKAMLDEVEADILRRAPVLELRAPAFCTFDNMNWFEELRVFDAAPVA